MGKSAISLPLTQALRVQTGTEALAAVGVFFAVQGEAGTLPINTTLTNRSRQDLPALIRQQGKNL